MKIKPLRQKYFDVVFLIEHKDRELDTVKEIAGCLKKEFGLSSYVISAYFHTPCLLFIRTKMLVMPYIFSQDLELVKSARRIFGDKVFYVNMNWEQVLSEGMKESKAPRDDFVKRKVIHLAWDDAFKNYLVSHGVFPGNVYVTGRPYTMLFRNMQERRGDLRSHFAAQFGLDEKKKWFFFPDNFGWKFQSDKAIRARIRGGWAADKAYEYRRFSEKCFIEFARFIKKMDEKKLDPIVIRPHPSITVEEYAEAFRDYGILVSERVKFLKDGTANEWVTASDVIGSSWSTVILDAFHLGKQCFLFQPFDLPPWLTVPWHEQVRRIRRFEEFEEFLHEGDSVPKASARVGGDPVRQTAHVIQDICRSVEPVSAKWTVSKDFLMPATKGLLFRLTPFRTNSKKYLLDYFQLWAS
jgi:surface carbohydrate biosynthesis protein